MSASLILTLVGQFAAVLGLLYGTGITLRAMSTVRAADGVLDRWCVLSQRIAASILTLGACLVAQRAVERHLLEAGVLVLYFLTFLALAAFGLHRYMMVYLYYRFSDRRALPAPLPAKLPRVTVQLPICNEAHVVARLLESVARIRYPRELLEIQVLDDSTDETSSIVRAAVEHYRGQGFDMHYLHRADRTGFKAGALAAGLKVAAGEFVLIFDADSIAPPDILEKAIGHFADGGVGLVQVRRGSVNRTYSLLTEVQSILLDGHFVLEHGGRNRSRRFFAFDGSAGIWRRKTIEDAGGWQYDTLLEDLDLSYRAQLKGWRFVFLQDVVSPAEVPAEMSAFKSQQYRWTKGSVQTCRKLLPGILASALPVRMKVEATFHLTASLAYPLIVLFSLLMFPIVVFRYNMGMWEMLMVDVPLFMGATTSVCSFYLLSQEAIFGEQWKSRLKYLPAALAVGIGISVNNAKAVIEALAGHQSEFERTPKYKVEAQKDATWKQQRYRGTINWVPFAELGLGLYLTAMAYYAATNDLYGVLPFVCLFQAGFLYSGGMSLLENVRRYGSALSRWLGSARRV